MITPGRYRIKDMSGATILDLHQREPFRLGDISYPRDWITGGGALPEGYTVEAYEPTPPAAPPPDPKAVVLSPRQFAYAVESMAGLTASDPLPDEWLAQQIEASTVIPPQDKRRALIDLRKASQFERTYSLMDALGQAILGKTPAEIDAAFLAAANLTA